MDTIDKRKLGIATAVVAGIVVLVFLGKWLINKQEASKETARIEQKRRQAEKERRQTQLLFHQICRYADSVGIDTSRYAATSKTDILKLEAEMKQLLMEVRYGKKPSRLAFSGLKETVDSGWVEKVETIHGGQSLAALATFRPYNQLVGHYNRLRKRASAQPAIADSLRLIRQTLNFYRYVNRFDPDQFVLVNIPAGELNVFDRTG